MLPFDTAPENDAAKSTGENYKCHLAGTVFRISVYTRSKHRPRYVQTDDKRVYRFTKSAGAIYVMLYIYIMRFQ